MVAWMDSTILTHIIVSHRWLNSHFVLFKADTNCGYPSTLSHSHSNEQCHTHARARRGIWLWMSRWEGLHQFLLLFRGLPLWSLAAWQVAHSHRQDRLVCTYLLPNCFCALQSGLLGLLSLSLGAAIYTVLSYCSFHSYLCFAPYSKWHFEERDPPRNPQHNF